MLPVITMMRESFNEQYNEEDYFGLLDRLKRECDGAVEFRIAETPCFFPVGGMDELSRIGQELTFQLIDNPRYLARAEEVIPEAYRMAGSSVHPHFMTVDFGWVRDADGMLKPKLVELQAFPSVFAFQVALSKAYKDVYKLDDGLSYFLGGHNEGSFWALFRRVVVGEHDPKSVVLAEIHPDQQKTRCDFVLTARALGIAVIDITEVEVDRTANRARLFYRDGDQRREIRRIYNRVIVDELIQKKIGLPFEYGEELDVEWAGHPNWYFKISKFSIPFLRHEAVPEAVFLDQWLRGEGSATLHERREDILLKPLFSFAGKGIVFAPTDEDLARIPAEERGDYLVQERVHFAPIIATPYGPTQAEVRILYLWPDGGKLEPVLSLVRLGRGKMMGVDHNRDQRWVGASTAFFPTR